MMGIVQFDLTTIKPEQDTVVPQVRFCLESVIQDHPSVRLHQARKQLGRLFRLKSCRGKALSQGIESKPMGSRCLGTGADLFGDAVPDVELFRRHSQGAIDHGQSGGTASSTSVDGALRLKGNRRHVVHFASERTVSAVSVQVPLW